MNDHLKHTFHILTAGLIGDAGIAAFQAPDPNMIQQYGSLFLQGIVTLFTIIAAVKKLRQKPGQVADTEGNAS